MKAERLIKISSDFFSKHLKFFKAPRGAGIARSLYVNDDSKKITQKFVVKPYIEGKDLSQCINEITNNDVSKNSVIQSLISNLKDFHSKTNRIHRDLKPANIIIHSNKATIIDDDISCLKEGSHTMNVGTPEYSAPEISLTEQYDEKVDIYSLGMIIYFIETGRNPFDTLKQDKDWFDEVQFHPNHSLWFYPTVTSVFLKRIILDCINSDPNKRPTLDELSRTRIFPGDIGYSNLFIKYLSIDDEMAESLADDIYYSLLILIEGWNHTCNFAADFYSMLRLQVKILLNGYFLTMIDIYKELHPIDDIDLLYAISHQTKDELLLINHNELAVNPFDILLCSMNTMEDDKINFKFFTENCKVLIKQDKDWDPLSLMYIFPDECYAMSYIEFDSSFSNCIYHGKGIAKDRIAASYYSIKYCGITNWIDQYVDLTIDDKDDILINLSINDMYSTTVSRIVGYLLNQQCPRAFDFLDVVRHVAFINHIGSFYGLWLYFISFLNSGDECYLENFMFQYRNILTSKVINRTNEYTYNTRDGRKYTLPEFTLMFILKKRCLLNSIQMMKYPIIMIRDQTKYIGFRSQKGDPFLLYPTSILFEETLYRLDAIDALFYFLKSSILKYMNVVMDLQITNCLLFWDHFYTFDYKFESQYDNYFLKNILIQK